MRAFRGRFDHPCDVVAFPRDERDIGSLLEWCAGVGAAAIPYGGGTSVVGGVEAAVGDRYAGAVSIDLRRLDRVLDIDVTSRAARIQAGANGPGLEAQLRDYGLTLRHFPQSFELSTLGGWIATRAGGHFATLYTHIDNLVESVRAVTPSGELGKPQAAGVGRGTQPGPNADRLGGNPGVITEAWVRVQARPVFKTSAAVHFADFADGAEAVRALSQSGLFPTNCRLLDPREAAITGAVRERLSPGDSGAGDSLLVVGFESADHNVNRWMHQALECCADYGGAVRAAGKSERQGEAGTAAPTRSAPGATPSCARPTCATPSLRWGS